MLAEFLFTPEALVDNDGRNGSEVVRELKRCFSSSSSSPTAIACKLGDDQWIGAVNKQIARIADRNHRSAAISFLKWLLENCSVSRPATNNAINDESGWIESGVKSALQVPLDNIVTSRQQASSKGLEIRLSDFISEQFWEKHPNPRFVDRTTSVQNQALRTVCVHSDWILLRFPYVKGGCEDEIVTVKQVIGLSSKLPEGFSKSFIRLQVCERKGRDSANLISSVFNEIAGAFEGEVRIQIEVVPEFLNRELIAGDFTVDSSGKTFERPRWLITMSHVAVAANRNRNLNTSANTWNLFDRRIAFERFEEIRSASPVIKSVQYGSLREGEPGK